MLTTLHLILAKPHAAQRSVMDDLTQRRERIVVVVKLPLAEHDRMSSARMVKR
jgi:hypothetical protein